MKVENLKTKEKPKKKGQHGGPREGSGRKPRLEHEARKLFNNFFDDNWETIQAKLEKHIKKGDNHVLLKMLEQRIGKAPQAIKVGGDKKNPLVVNVVKYE